jgi:hypothetical protein
MSVNVGDVATSVGKGLFAGVVGTAAMTISSTLEMKIRGRPGSSAPSEAVARSDARYRLAEALAALLERERTVLCADRVRWTSPELNDHWEKAGGLA